MSLHRKTLFGNKTESGKRWRRFLLWGLIAAAGVLIAGIVAWYQLLNYLQSDSFRSKLEEQLRAAAHAQELSLQSPLSINGDRIEQEGLSLRESGAFSMVRVGHISMDIDRTALLNRNVHIRKISVDDGEILMESRSPKQAAEGGETSRPAQRKGKGTQTPQPTTAETKPAATAEKTTLLRPKHWELELMECKATDITLRRDEHSLQLLNCSLTTTPMKGGGWQHQMENGRVHTPFSFLRGAGLKSATLTQVGTSRDLTDCRIMLSPGEMRLRGHLDNATGKWSANINLNKASISPILHGDWQKRVTGELFGKMTLTGKHASLEAGEGYLSLQQGVLEGLPFLSALPAGGGYPYRHLELDKAECRISYPFDAPELRISNAWLFDGINIRAKGGWLRVRGHVIIGTDGSLGGTLTIGIPAAVASALPSAELASRLFNATGEEGYAWMNMNLSGTLDEPEEDLSVRCAALMKDLLPGAALRMSDTAEQMFRLLLNPPAAPKAQEGEGTDTAPLPAEPIKRAAEGVQQGINSALKLLF